MDMGVSSKMMAPPCYSPSMSITPRYTRFTIICLLLLTGLTMPATGSAEPIPLPKAEKAQNTLLQSNTPLTQPKTAAPFLPTWLTDTIKRIITGGAQWETIKRSDGRPTTTP